MDWSEEDKENAETFLKPFGEFLRGREVDWRQGRDGDSASNGGGGKGKGEDRLRLLDEDGVTHEDVEDEDWERCMRVGEVVWRAQKEVMEKGQRDAVENAQTGVSEWKL